MKVTAIIDEKVIKDAMKYSKATTITETLKVALNEMKNTKVEAILYRLKTGCQ